MKPVKPKKHLGQHFLKDENIAEKIANSLTSNGYSKVIEVGGGMGVLTRFLLQKKEVDLRVFEVDTDSVQYLKEHYPELEGKVEAADFLKTDLSSMNGEPVAVIGNFPYNISTQILFKVYHNRKLVKEAVGMFQKEVAQRIASPPGNKSYGILSVLLQAFYDIEYLFTVPENVFIPPPKVKSGVIRLIRNDVQQLDCNEKLFFTVVKTAFNQRRKTLRNALKSLVRDRENFSSPLLQKRAEQLSVLEFVELTNIVERSN